MPPIRRRSSRVLANVSNRQSESDATLVDKEEVYESDTSESDPYDSDESYDATDEVFEIDDEIGLEVLREEAKEVRAAAAAASAADEEDEEDDEDEEVDDEEEDVSEKSKSRSKRKRKSQSQSQSNKKKKKSTWTEPSPFDPGPEFTEHVRKALRGHGPTILETITDVSKGDINNNCIKHTLQLTQYSFSYTPAKSPCFDSAIKFLKT
jgi:flagellar biosynthesis GTPase FlhF